MAKLDARFCGLDAASETFNDQVMFDRTNRSANIMRSAKNKSMQQTFDAENTKKFQVSFNMEERANKSLFEQYKQQQALDKPKGMFRENTTNQNSVRPSQLAFNEVPTPLYAKNPNMTNNKISEILEISRDNKHINQTVSGAPAIVPSPSGITRCYVTYDESAGLNKSKAKDTVQVNYMNPSNLKASSVSATGKVDSGTSPFVVLNSNSARNELQNNEDIKNTGTISNALDAVTSTEYVLHGQSKPFEGTEYLNKKLAKSKVIFVNLTPRANLEDVKNQTKTTEQQQRLLVDEAYINEKVNYNTSQHFANQPNICPESVMTTTYLERSNMNANKTIETPVSAKKFYPHNERLNPIAEEDKTDKNQTNQILLNNKTFSYYDNIIRTDKNENDFQQEQTDEADILDTSYNNPNFDNKNDNELIQFAAVPRKFRYLAPQTVENIQHISGLSSQPLKQDQQIQFPSSNNLVNMTENYDNYKKNRDGLKRYNPDSIDDDIKTELVVSGNLIRTYYDGKRCWTSLASSRSIYDNKNYELNEGYEPSNDSLRKGKLYQNNEEIDGKLKKKNDLHVKIKLPDDSVEKVSIKKSSKRKCQNFCFIMLIFLIFAVVITILVYFVGLDEFARQKLFSSEIWKKLVN